MTVIEVPPDSLFGLDNLPYGVFSPPRGAPRVGVRLSETVVDLSVLLGDEFGPGLFTSTSLNAFMATGRQRWIDVRSTLRERLTGDVPNSAVHALDTVRMHLPIDVADYVDFYASEHHASNLGRLFRPESPEPLLPNWRHLPVGYHGRAGTVVVSGSDVVRPHGQRKAPSESSPTFGPSIRLDIEAELGFVVGHGSALGVPVPVDEAENHLFGAVLLNDWSARDIQAWEYVPLGPHLGKSFASSISAWVVPMLALQAAKVELPRHDPQVLDYLRMSRPWGLDVDLAVEWNGQVISRPPYRTMYWSPAQMLAHQCANGASCRTGDLLGSGTVSGPRRREWGALIELTWNGTDPLLVDGRVSTFLLDGDRISITASAPGPGAQRIGFGEVVGRIVPAPAG